MSNIENLFTIPVYKNSDYKLSEEEIDTIRHVCGFGKINQGQNLTTYERYLFDTYETLKKFKEYCQQQVNHYAHEVLKIDEKQKFYITQSWGNLNAPGTNHHPHIHLNSLISAVYFVKGGSSPIVFQKNLSNYLFPNFEFVMKEFNEYNSDSWQISNTENTLLLFPSSLKHFVTTNNNDFNRISVSFNVFVKGEIGDSSQATELKL